MITLNLNVAYRQGETGKALSVTSDQLELVNSPGGVGFLILAIPFSFPSKDMMS